MTHRAQTVIVGGGIWGLSTAFHLARSGYTDVCVLERNEKLSEETTSQAAGLVGQVRSTPLMMNAIRYAIDLFSQFPSETGHNPGFHQVGSLLTALTPEHMDSYEEQVRFANDNSVEAHFVDHDEISALVPTMDVSRVLGGYFVPNDGYVDPQRCARAFGAAVVDQGINILTGSRVVELKVDDDRTVGVETEEGFIEAERVIVTAGPWTGVIAKSAGIVLATQPIRHQRVRTSPVAGIPDYHPVVRVTDTSCYVRPEGDGYLYGFFEPDPLGYDLEATSSEFGTRDIEAPVQVMEEARRRLAPIFPILEELEVAEYKRGLTTFAPDGNYLVGPVSAVEGLYVASGCASLGIAGSAAVGKWLAGWVTEGGPGEDVSQVDPERFGEQAADQEWVRRESERFYGNYYSIESMSIS